MKNKIPLGQAKQEAQALIARLAPYCKRIAEAGSVRRGDKEFVGDIEIVAMPTDDRSIEFYAKLLGAKALNDGQKYLKLELSNGMQLDLFMVFDPMQWGYIFCQRTGPADFNKKLFTPRTYGGLRPRGLAAEDGYIYLNGALQDTSTEEQFLACFGLDWIAPSERSQFASKPKQASDDIFLQFLSVGA